MSDLKQVKVDNWGIYFLQRLKHFFNRTDYCDLTLQFQDNAQLKVHRLVLSACTEYFEVLERTCEMYEDCLVMPDDLQADVVVPIINFMYTGQLEFKPELLEKLHLTSLIMNMPVLTKLLDAQKLQNTMQGRKSQSHSYGKQYQKPLNKPAPKKAIETGSVASSSRSVGIKRSFNKSFDSTATVNDRKSYQPPAKIERTTVSNNGITTIYRSTSPSPLEAAASARKVILGEPRPTRYELPEELETDNIYSNSFTSISYTSDPLMVHPETTKKYSKKSEKSNLFQSSSGKMRSKATVDIVNCKPGVGDSWFEPEIEDNDDVFKSSITNTREACDPSQLFDQILDHGPKVTIENKMGKAASNIDHAKIISEVLKKYPHLVKNNKNIKLKILDSSTPSKPKKTVINSMPSLSKIQKKSEMLDYTYESEVLDSKEAASLIALGAENIRGPWICLICGTPGRAIHFQSYLKFRRHLVEVHNEKPVSNICEYCGLKSNKRNYLLHHLYTKHGVPPPPQYRFPKCKSCNYIALTESLLNKHKATHLDPSSFRCNVCSKAFGDSNTLLLHIQTTGHKYTAEKKNNIQCIYCMKLFSRESNLYTHLKTHHKIEAKEDGVIEDSDDDNPKNIKKQIIKCEPKPEYEYDSENDSENIQYQIEQRPDGQVHLVTKRSNTGTTPMKQKILNPGFGNTIPKSPQKINTILNATNTYIEKSLEHVDEDSNEDIIVIGDVEYIMKENQLIPRKQKASHEEYIVSEMIDEESSNIQNQSIPSNTIEYTNLSNIVQNTDGNIQPQASKMIIKKAGNINQPIQIVVSNEEEYKALMSSNHSIIFDESDASKTLTVLTAPHGSTSIDLENAQRSDMMILPDYPINVSQAVPSDSSNIVVVYSHPIDDQNKSYQLPTQFVQSSATFTQNYETVTTSSTVLTTATTDIQNGSEPAWQNNVTSTNIENTFNSEIQEMDIIEDINNKNDGDIDINQLPEIQLSTPQEPSVINNISASEQETETLNNEIDDSLAVQTIHETVPSTNEVNELQEVTESDSAPVITDSKVTQNENLTLMETNDDASLVIIQEHSEFQQETEEDVENEEHIEMAQVVEEEQSQSSEDIERLPLNENSEVEQTITLQSNIVEQNKYVDSSSQESQPMSLKWSEEESQEPNSESIVQNFESEKKIDVIEEVPAEEEMPTEVEESIENIQHEMEKQMSENNVTETEHEKEMSSENDLQKPEENSTDDTENQDVGPKEKLSSLLNDWDENDSQEGLANETDITEHQNDTTEHQFDTTEQNQNEIIEESPAAVEETQELLPNDPKNSLKNLVSDWDDEEDES